MGWLKKEKETEQDQRGCIPPGQYLTEKWPVLHAGSAPRFDPHTWDFCIFGLVETALRLNYQEFMSLPQAKIISDVHCVTAWIKLDNEWEGVAVRELMKRVKILPEARFVVTPHLALCTSYPIIKAVRFCFAPSDFTTSGLSDKLVPFQLAAPNVSGIRSGNGRDRAERQSRHK